MVFVWLALAVVYWFAGMKITEWKMINRLGYFSEVPVLFLKKSYLYSLFLFTLFLALFLMPFFFVQLPVFLTLAILILVLWVSVKGRQNGIKLYRGILRDILDSSNGKELQDIKAELKMTDAEILNKLKKDEEFKKIFSRGL